MKRFKELFYKIPWLMKMHWVLFTREGTNYYFYLLRSKAYRFKVAVLSFFDLWYFSKNQWTNKASRKQIHFLRDFRSPKVLMSDFRQILRVCLTYRCNMQ